MAEDPSELVIADPADEAGATTEFGDPDQCVGR